LRRCRRGALAAALLASAAATPAEAQCSAAPDTRALITAIEVRPGDVFDTTEANRWWQRLGNALHRVTHPDVIRRELLLETCTPYDSARAAETERNLRALGTFRRVEVDTVRADTGVVVRVTTHDGWSTRPELTFSSTGNQTTFTIGLTEENLLGRATLAGVRYTRDPDRRSVAVRFAQRRTFGDFGLRLSGENRTDGWNGSAVLARPFFSYDARSAAGLMLVGFDGDVRRYRGGDRTPAEIFARRLGIAQIYAGRALSASARGYVRVGTTLEITSDAYAPIGDSASRRTVGSVAIWTEASRARFIEVEQFRTMGRAEDVDLSPRIHVGALLAPAAFGYDDGGIGLELLGQAGLPIGRGFVAAVAKTNGLFTGAGLDSGRVTVNATMLLRPGTHLAVLLHGLGGGQERPAPGEEFELGFGNGLRAHRAHAFTGDRVALVAGEVRWTALRELFGVLHVGVAAVGAHGGAWWAGDRRRTGSEIGGGLRMGPSRLAGGRIGRMDLMWRFATDREPGGWILVFGEGLTF
jgi:hypothetical protein